MLHPASNPLSESISLLVEQNFDKWCGWRRHLHKHPERSWQESATTRFIANRLEAFGLSLNTGPRGMGGWVDLELGDSATDRRIAIRGDIDAIPVEEANDVEYRSVIPSVMHACGHDVHTTIVLAVCETLDHLHTRNELPCPARIRLIFQPAEEVGQGARECIETGVLDGVDAILAVHVDPTRPVGQIGLRDGVQTAACDELQLQIEGTGGHGARPHETSDTVLAAAHFIQAAHALIPRIIDARENCVLSFCSIHGGGSANVIPVEVRIEGTLRSFDESVRTRILSRLERLAEATSGTFGVNARLRVNNSIPSVNNARELNRIVSAVVSRVAGDDAIALALPSLGGEDFACYQRRVPGALLRVGSAGEDRFNAHLHSPQFDVDERVIAFACQVLVQSIFAWFSSDREETA